MTKKGNLASALSGFDKRPAETETPKPVKAQRAAPKKTKAAAEGQGHSSLPPSRRGKKALTGYFDPEVLKQLKLLAASEDKTMQELMGEGINELFKKYGRPHIA